MKRFLVEALYWLCALVDYLPTWRNGRIQASQWGCYPLMLSKRALNLEIKWGMLND